MFKQIVIGVVTAVTITIITVIANTLWSSKQQLEQIDTIVKNNQFRLDQIRYNDLKELEKAGELRDIEKLEMEGLAEVLKKKKPIL